MRLKRNESRTSSKVEDKPTFICDMCKTRAVEVRRHQRFCSDICRIRHFRGTKDVISDKSRHVDAQPKCIECGKEYKRRAPHQAFCSPHCRYVAHCRREDKERKEWAEKYFDREKRRKLREAQQ
jgi:endogenous inhibitor of DNA gyrase (YacG/DUF329 family)